MWGLACRGGARRAATGELRSTTPCHSMSSLALRWNPSGTRVASGSFDGSLAIVNADGSLHRTVRFHLGKGVKVDCDAGVAAPFCDSATL
jgi:WD40 repeat protein